MPSTIQLMQYVWKKLALCDHLFIIIINNNNIYNEGT